MPFQRKVGNLVFLGLVRILYTPIEKYLISASVTWLLIAEIRDKDQKYAKNLKLITEFLFNLFLSRFYMRNLSLIPGTRQAAMSLEYLSPFAFYQISYKVDFWYKNYMFQGYTHYNTSVCFTRE